MEIKKNPKLDLGKKRPMFLSVGLMISLLFVTSAFQWSSEVQPLVVLPDIDPWDELVLEATLTKQTPPKRPKIILPVFKPVEDNIEPDDIDVVIDTDDMDPDDLLVVVDDPDDEPIIEAPVDWSEYMPEPVEGIKAFQKFLAKNIRYPNQARRMGIQGRVFIQFVVDKAGNITEIKTVKGIGSGCDEEAERVMGLASKWRPGRQGVKRVAVRMIMPIYFRLN